ncbi:MAG: hypothetical protein RLZ98_2012 [Pseudomonadota bacterium]|jgi:hypothetical protein
MKTLFAAAVLSLSMLTGPIAASAASYSDYPAWAEKTFQDASDRGE